MTTSTASTVAPQAITTTVVVARTGPTAIRVVDRVTAAINKTTNTTGLAAVVVMIAAIMPTTTQMAGAVKVAAVATTAKANGVALAANAPSPLIVLEKRITIVNKTRLRIRVYTHIRRRHRLDSHPTLHNLNTSHSRD